MVEPVLDKVEFPGREKGKGLQGFREVGKTRSDGGEII